MNNLFNTIKNLASQHEIFLVESPHNNYSPSPAKGWFAMRSNKRRVFMQLSDGKIPDANEIQWRLSKEEFVAFNL